MIAILAKIFAKIVFEYKMHWNVLNVVTKVSWLMVNATNVSKYKVLE